MTNFEALLLLNMVSQVGSVRLKKLIQSFGEPSRIFKASLHDLTTKGVLTPLMARAVMDAPNRFKVDDEIKEAQNKGIKILTLFDKEYPVLLKEIYDPPYVLYVKGDFLPADENAIGMVGSRGASYYGLSCAKQFASDLSSAGMTIVSGLARGIDTASHRSALDAKGRTIAVCGSGFNHIYPPENECLFHEIAEKGVVVTQFPLNMPPLRQNFPIRNRILSGLSLGVLVVEANVKSGALITARLALEQNREVFAIPGKVSSVTSLGTNDLIKQGAKLVTEPREILVDLKDNLKLNVGSRPLAASQMKNNFLNRLDAREINVMGKLSDEPKYIDHICEETGLTISEIMSVLVQLEIKGAVKQLPGKTFVVNNN